jgi:hypothetical protein
MNVRFEGNNGHDADVTRCLLLTQSGHLSQWWPTCALSAMAVRGSDKARCPAASKALDLLPKDVASTPTSNPLDFSAEKSVHAAQPK